MQERSTIDCISVCITACDEEQNIRRCLESVTWAGEIVVVDSFSKDRTPDICREYTDLVVQRPWLGYVGQKNYAKELATKPWIFFIDADEEVSPGLRDEIAREFLSGWNERYAGYSFPRMVRFLGRWIRHGDWYPDRKLRLFRKDKATCGGQEPHDQISVDGRVGNLKSPLFHYTYDNLHDQIASMNKFSTISACGKYRRKQRFTIFDLIFRPPFRFMKGYFLKLGLLDGLPGFMIAVSSAYGTFVKYSKLWELRKGLIDCNTIDKPV